MAEPKLQIEQRLDRIEAAILRMNGFLVDTEGKTDQECGEEIKKILRGEDVGQTS